MRIASMQCAVVADVAAPARSDACTRVSEVASRWPPRHAVVLATGPADRSAQSGQRSLLRVAGLGLVERSVLTLRAAGVEEIRIVDGGGAGPCDRDQIPPAAGDGSLLVLADHLMDAAFVRDFLARAAARPETAQVAAGGQPAIAGLFYLPPGADRWI